MSFIIGLLIVVLDIYAVIKILQSAASGMEKLLWILGVFLFPLVGLIIWYFAGPGRKSD